MIQKLINERRYQSYEAIPCLGTRSEISKSGDRRKNSGEQIGESSENVSERIT